MELLRRILATRLSVDGPRLCRKQGRGLLRAFIVYPSDMQARSVDLDSHISRIYTQGMSTTPKKRGRRPLANGTAKSESLLLRLAPREKQGFSDAASLAGVPLSIWIRERLRKAAAKELKDADKDVAFLANGVHSS
jgi:hypothetical protein